MCPSVPDSVYRAFFGDRKISRVDRWLSGLSGAQVFRCHDDVGNSFALRRWPATTKSRRVAEVHRVMHVARRNGCQLVPRLFDTSSTPTASSFFVAADGFLWELAQWMPGRPLNVDAEATQILRGVDAIKSFHQSVRELGVQEGTSPAVRARLDRCQQLDKLIPRITGGSSRPVADAALNDVVQQAVTVLRTRWKDVSRSIRGAMTHYRSLRLPLQYVLRDIHDQHLLFESDEPSAGGSPSGLIDYDAVRIDSPVVDLARWIGSFAASRSEGLWERALADLLDPCPSTESDSVFPTSGGDRSRLHNVELSLARDLAVATSWISLANWLVWLLLDRREYPGGSRAVAERLAKWVRWCRPDFPDRWG